MLFDGAYRKDEAGKLHFFAAPALTPKERLTLVTRIASRIERLLDRRGFRQACGGEPTQLELSAMKVPPPPPVHKVK